MKIKDLAMSSHLRKRKLSSFTVAEKLQAVEYAKTHTLAETALFAKASKSSICEWKADSDELKKVSDKKRRKLEGGGRSVQNDNLERTAQCYVKKQEIRVFQ